ncbi:ABC transporter substrate-binding protein [Planctomycetota bacterium]|nr:ABC transporter substrate-binding protein [Planctomycetota bacterium]
MNKFILYVFALVFLIMSGCSGEENIKGKSNSNHLTIGFSQIGAESSWRTAETESIRSEAKKRNHTLKFSDAQQKQENQIKALNAFIAQNVDAIILAPVVETGWEPVLRNAKKRNIPVILVDRGVIVADDSLYTTLIATDFVNEGRLAGEWIIKNIGTQANIVELEGTPGSSAAIDRQKGFMQAISSYPKLKVTQSQTGEFTRAKGKEVMEAFLKSSKDKIDVVFAHNDDMALGAIQAIEEAGYKPGVDIKLVSVDGVLGAFQAMVAGKLNCTVECNPLLGDVAFDAVERAVSGKKVEKRIVIEDRVFDQSVAKDVIESRKY